MDSKRVAVERAESDIRDADGVDAGAAGTETDAFDVLLRRAARLTPLPSPRALQPGTRLCGGRFEIARRIGAGGMGVVYEAMDHAGGRTVALKALARLDPGGVYRLKNEFRALAGVTHPNLIRLHELFGDDGLWLFTMELVAGQPFDRWVRPSDQLDLDRLRAALPQLVAGVAAIHDAGKLHRDIKPNNVLVNQAGQVVILDFGLVADRTPGGAGHTLPDDVAIGTPAYMAPELFAAAPASSASDWYSVGVTLFEALTGRLPFESAVDATAGKYTLPAPRASAFVRGLPEDLDALCAALLAREPALRPSEAAIAEMLDAGAQARAAVTTPQPKPPAAALLGRAAELEAFRDAYAAARAGQAMVLRVSGESGMGKSALVEQFLDELRSAGDAVVLSGRCYERENVPYKAFDRVVDELTRYLRTLRPVDVASVLPRDAAALLRIFPVLGRVELIASSPARRAADDHALRQYAFHALADMLAKIRDRHMLVLCIDDLQWLDQDSLRLLEHLLGHHELPPLLFIVSYHALGTAADGLLKRVETEARANRLVELRDVTLGPLSFESACELASRILGEACSQQLADSVAHEAAGNPFLIGELARHAAEPGADVEPDGVSLDHAVRVRAERLGAGASQLLALLAVSGRPTPFDVLSRATDDGVDTAHMLDLLRHAQFVRDSGARAYECYHDRIRAAVCEDLGDERTREIHLRLARAWSERENPDAEVLFAHCLAAGKHEEAAQHAINAAGKAASSLAFERSAAFYAQAIELLPASEAERLALRERQAEALSLAGRWAEAGHAYAEAAEQSDDPVHRAELQRDAARCALGSGHSAEGLPRLRALFAASNLHWPRTRAGALFGALIGLSWAGVRSVRYVALAPPPLQETVDDEATLDHLLVAAGCVPPYDYARGLYFMAEFARRALRSGATAHVSVALGMLATLLASTRLTRGFARRLADRACTMARAHRVYNLQSVALSFAAWARLVDDRLRDALALSIEAGEALRSSGRKHIYEVWAGRTVQSMALVGLGRMRDAVEQYAANGQLGHELGDAMAVLAGDSVLRHLVADDLDRAHALLEHKTALLARTQATGGLRDFVQLERLVCALYAGTGPDALRHSSPGESLSFAMPEYGALRADCALQALPAQAKTARRIVRRTIRRLRWRDRSSADRAMVAQFEAALHLLDGDTARALESARRSIDLYRSVEMALHEAAMIVRYGELRGDAEGARMAERARAFMVSEGIVRPDAWVGMLTPGLGRR